MKYYDSKSKQNIPKRKFYNIGPITTVDNIDKVETGFDLFAISKKTQNDKWFTFLQKHLDTFNPLPFPFEEQLPFLYFISSDEMQYQLFKQLSKISSYDPNYDPIPFDKLNENVRNYLEKRKQDLVFLNQNIKDGLFVKNNIIGIYYSGSYSKELDNIFNLLKIDIVIYANEKDLTIVFKEYPIKFYEIKGKNIDTVAIFTTLQDFCGEITKKDNIYTLNNTIEKGELLDIIQNNIL